MWEEWALTVTVFLPLIGAAAITLAPEAQAVEVAEFF